MFLPIRLHSDQFTKISFVKNKKKSRKRPLNEYLRCPIRIYI